MLTAEQKSTLEDCIDTLQAAIRGDHGQVVTTMNLMAVSHWIREVADEMGPVAGSEPRPFLTATVEPGKRGSDET